MQWAGLHVLPTGSAVVLVSPPSPPFRLMILATLRRRRLLLADRQPQRNFPRTGQLPPTPALLWTK